VADNDNPMSASGRYNQEALVALIDSRFNHNIERWYTLYWQPMHTENKAELAAIKNMVTGIMTKMSQAEGGLSTGKIIAAALWTIAALVIGHFWK
jgi:hypothetical protein